MKNIMLIFVLFFCMQGLSAQSNSQKVSKDVVKNVVLINKSPWEVLMTRNGDILAKLKDIPDYLKGFEENPNAPVVDNLSYPETIVKSTPVTISELRSNPRDVAIPGENEMKRPDTPDFEDTRLEVVFNLGSALLTSNQINFLNSISSRLIADKSLKFNLFGFNSEPEYRFYILSKRRMDAVLSYLKVKGVDIDKQIIVNSSIKGKNNKIVFAQAR